MPLQLEIVTPERLAYSDTVDSVVLPGAEGEMGVLPHHAPLLATLGVGIVIREGVKLLFGAGYRQVSNPLPGDVAVGPVAYPIYRLLLIAITVAILAALAGWLYRTAPGLRLRAMLQDRETAAAYGIDPDRASLFAFIVGAALAGLAGALMSPLVTVGPDVGIIYLARAFMVVVVGGVGSLLGLVGGGVIIGAVAYAAYRLRRAR